MPDQKQQQIDLTRIPVDWVTINPSGEIVIKHKGFSEAVQQTLRDKASKVLRDNGGCNCGA
jgi:hypothetical protein